MAVLKHIASKNADYGEAIKYLLFQHNEEAGKPILDDQGRMMLREEYYMDGINCDPMEFDHQCEKTNAQFHKNQRFDEIKAHHYIISFDPKDVADHGLTGEKAQAMGLEYARKYFPGHQALVVTHTDGHNQSGNIHTHIVINSLRCKDAPEADFLERPCDHKAGYKHHLTKEYLKYLEKAVMEMCEKEGLHQVDLLHPAPVKITQEEYWAKRRGQKQLEKENEEIRAEGLNPRSTEFRTQKQRLRDAIDDIAKEATDMADFSNRLSEKYDIEANLIRSHLGYSLPGRERRITEKSLGTHYGYEYLSEKFKQNQLSTTDRETDYHKNPYAIFYFKSSLRLVVELQESVNSQNAYSVRNAKLMNLRQMAETIIYVQDHHYDSRDEMRNELSTLCGQLENEQKKYAALQAELAGINEQIHYTGQYYANGKIFREMLKAPNKAAFRTEHAAEIATYEEARRRLKELSPDGTIPSMNDLKQRKEQLQRLIAEQKDTVQQVGDQEKELQIAAENVDTILDQLPVQEQKKSYDEELS